MEEHLSRWKVFVTSLRAIGSLLKNLIAIYM